jgi:peptide/nickel transport system substrate-binding protein
MRRLAWNAVLLLASGPAALAFHLPQAPQSGEELQIGDSEVGHYGGSLVVAQGAEPRTLNPVTAADVRSREVIGQMMADLIHINRESQKTEPSLAKSWTASRDGRVFTLKLRRGLRFSDGQPFNADDVVFSFRVYLDEKIHSPQRDLLIVGGQPIAVQRIDSYTVRFTLTQPYAAAERIFDSLAMMPRHLLEKAYHEERFTQVWNVNTPPAEMAGMGPFRLKQYVPGQRIVLERNPYFWKIDQKKNRLPYLNELIFLFAGNEDAQVIRFQAGDTDIISRVNAENYALLSRDAQRHYELFDLGPSLEYNFLLFNLNDVKGPTASTLGPQLAWFSDLKFRQAVSSVIDREAIVKLVYAGRGMPLWGNVSPSNKLWMNQFLPHPARSLENARDLLKSAGFSWRNDGRLMDRQKRPVEFSIIASSSNNQRTKIATIIQSDLSQLGMDVHVVPLEFRALLDRVLQTFDYEAAVMGLGGGDADPNPEMNVWLSSGSAHLWHLGETKPATDWEAQIDQLMQKQMIELNYGRRKRLYDQVQEIIAANLPYVFLATPNVMVGAKKNLENFKPAILEPTALWNVEHLFFRQGTGPSVGAER